MLPRDSRRRAWFLGLFFSVCAASTPALQGEEPSLDDSAAQLLGGATDQLPNVPLRTFGGLQYWNDERVVGEWRIQRNVLSGHHRLIDSDEHRQAWGDFDACERRLQLACEAGDAVPVRGEVVVVLHGLGSGRWATRTLCEHLRVEGFQVVSVGYSTTSGHVADHAATLAKVIEGLPDAEKIHFVAHSLGNIVVRHYLADHADRRLGRMVMLAPPNHGSSRACTWAQSMVVVKTLGPVVKELGPDWQQLEPKLATPREFGVIAGGLGNDHGYNLVVEGDDDGTLSIEETKLDGAADFLVVPSLHSLILARDDVQAATTRFLRHGRFQEPNQRDE